jgi:hypothetical protein
MIQRHILPPYGLSDEEATAIYQAKRKKAFVAATIFGPVWLGFWWATLFFDLRKPQWTEVAAFAVAALFVRLLQFSLRCPNCTIIPQRAFWLFGSQATNAQSCHNCGVKLGGTQPPAQRNPGQL